MCKCMEVVNIYTLLKNVENKRHFRKYRKPKAPVYYINNCGSTLKYCIRINIFCSVVIVMAIMNMINSKLSTPKL